LGLSIKGFKHSGLKRFFDGNDGRRLPQDRLNRIDDILAKLTKSDALDALGVPGYRLHLLKGDRKGYWSVRVSANWRIVFRFESGNVYDVDLIDYH
jgi:proteic killer suppression protein